MGGEIHSEWTMIAKNKFVKHLEDFHVGLDWIGLSSIRPDCTRFAKIWPDWRDWAGLGRIAQVQT
jgi:hypothetical protein